MSFPWAKEFLVFCVGKKSNYREIQIEIPSNIVSKALRGFQSFEPLGSIQKREKGSIRNDCALF